MPALVRVLLVAAAAGVALAACGGTDDAGRGGAQGSGPAPATSPTPTAPALPTPTPSPTARPIEVTVADGQVQGSVRRVPVAVGETVRLQVSSDVADEVHVHGYDRIEPVAAGGRAVLEFTANIPGVFEVELEQRGLKLLELEVGG
ncbi:MAG TPA: hypothetical protein VHF25_17255 [Nitriliruptorales bacterium]|nr:hypothetical protein [Nitriliruptorales bacterium]